MAGIIDTIKQGITNKGASALRAISSVNPTLGGKVGKVVDTIGKALNNPFPEAYASEGAQSAGGYAQYNQATTPEQKAAVEQKALNTSGFSSANVSSLPGAAGTVGEYKVDPNNLDQMFNVNGEMKTGRTILAETGGTGTYSKGGGDNPPPLSQQDVKNALKGKEDFISQEDLNTIMNKYAGSSRDSADALAAEIERTATENADREYNTIKEALGVQKGEVNTVAGQQKRRIDETKAQGLADLTDKQTTEEQNIEKQKAGFLSEVADTTETLAKNWRDMSMQVQRIARARGNADSSFSASTEKDVLLDFNKGLRTLAKQSTTAVQDFADAVVETNKFYTREKANLETEARQAAEDVDTWVRQQVQSIQAQENMAVAKKLSDIRSAISQGNQLKIQTEQSINEKQFALDSWIVQTNVNYKNAVALAAKGKTDDAAKQLAAYRDQAKQSFDLVTKGGYAPEVVKDANGKAQYVIHGKLPDGTDDYIPMTASGFDVLTQNVYGSLTKSNDPYALPGSGSVQVDPTSINSARSQAGLPSIGTSQSTTSSSGGILDTIKNMFL